MSSTGVRRIRDTSSRTADSILDEERSQIESEKIFTETNVISGNNGIGTANQGTAAGNYLSKNGDIRGGPMGNEFAITTISNDAISVDISSLNFFPFLILNGEGGLDDTLSSITPGVDVFSNQELFLQAGVDNITLTEILANPNPILTPNSADVVLAPGEMAKVVYSPLVSAWVVNWVSSGGGGGLVDPILLPQLSNVPSPTNETAPTLTSLSWSTNVIHVTVDRDLAFSFADLPVTNKYEGFLVILDIDGTGGYASPTWPASVTNPPIIPTTANTRFSVVLYTINNGTTVTNATSVGSSTGGSGNVPDAVSQYQHLESDGGLNWIAQQALAFGANSGSSGQLNFPNDVIGLAWSNATFNGDIQLKTTVSGVLDLTRTDNTAMSYVIRAQNAVEADQSLSFTVGSGSVTTADIVIDASTAKMKFAAGGAQRLEIDSTTQTDLNLRAPSGGALATFNVTSTDAVDPDNTITMTISGGTSGIGQLESSTAFLNLIAGGATRLAIDSSVGTDITQTAFSINPVYDLFRADTTNDTDIIGTLNFSANNSIAAKKLFGSIFVEATDVTDLTEDATMYLSIIENGTISEKLTLEAAGMVLRSGSLRLDEIASPANPPANQGLFFAKDVSGVTTPFWKDSAGTETDLILTAGANTTLSNLTSPTALNQDLNLGTNSVVFNSSNTMFFQALTTSTLNLSMPTGTDFRILFNSVVEWAFTSTSLTGDNVVLGNTLTINNSSTYPVANGIFSRNGNVLAIEIPEFAIRRTTTTGAEFTSLNVVKVDASPGTNDTLGRVNFQVDDTGVITTYAGVFSEIRNATDAGRLQLGVRADNTASLHVGLQIEGDDNNLGSFMTINSRIVSDVEFGVETGATDLKIFPGVNSLGITVQDNAAYTIGTNGTIAIPSSNIVTSPSAATLDTAFGTHKGAMGWDEPTTPGVDNGRLFVRNNDGSWYSINASARFT